MKIRGNKVVIRPKKPSDVENDYLWQTDPELSALDAMEPSTMPFREFYREYIGWLKHPNTNRITFGIDTPDGKHIGNCVYYNIDEDKQETEIGIMIGNFNYWNKGYGVDTISTLIDYIFRDRKFNRVYLKTLETNLHAQKCFQKCGLTSCGFKEKEGYKFLLMEMTYSQWRELKNQGKLASF